MAVRRETVIRVAALIWLIALTVLALWPVLGDAPWEGAAAGAAEHRMLLCRDSLERRQVALAALAAPRGQGDREYSADRRQLSTSPAIPPWTEAERQLKAAQDDIDQLC